jgi:hypothetical protein
VTTKLERSCDGEWDKREYFEEEDRSIRAEDHRVAAFVNVSVTFGQRPEGCALG